MMQLNTQQLHSQNKRYLKDQNKINITSLYSTSCINYITQQLQACHVIVSVGYKQFVDITLHISSFSWCFTVHKYTAYYLCREYLNIFFVILADTQLCCWIYQSIPKEYMKIPGTSGKTEYDVTRIKYFSKPIGMVFWNQIHCSRYKIKRRTEIM